MPPPQPTVHLGILCLKPAPYQPVTVRHENTILPVSSMKFEVETQRGQVCSHEEGRSGENTFQFLSSLPGRATEKSLQPTCTQPSVGFLWEEAYNAAKEKNGCPPSLLYRTNIGHCRDPHRWISWNTPVRAGAHLILFSVFFQAFFSLDSCQICRVPLRNLTNSFSPATNFVCKEKPFLALLFCR